MAASCGLRGDVPRLSGSELSHNGVSVTLTKQSEYALQGLAFLASRPLGYVVALAEIAEARTLPASFLAKIFQKLARHGLVEAERGSRAGGYVLNRGPEAITVREILEAVEGPRVVHRCLLWQGHCDDANPCPLHYRLQTLRPQLEALLDTITLAEYAMESTHQAPSRRGGMP